MAGMARKWRANGAQWLESFRPARCPWIDARDHQMPPSGSVVFQREMEVVVNRGSRRVRSPTNRY